MFSVSVTSEPEPCPEFERITVTKGLHYVRSDSDDMVANIYFIQDSKFSPLVLYFNSSSFRSGDRRDCSDLCKSIASRGMVCVDVRLRPVTTTDGIEGRLRDIGDLIKWISNYDSVYNFDLNRVYCIGTGMGAVAAVWVAIYCNSERFKYLHGELPFKIKGLGLFNGHMSVKERDGDCKELTAFMNGLMRRDRHLYNWMDPWATDAEGIPPSFIVTSDNDSAKYDCFRFKELLDREEIPARIMSFTEPSLKTNFMERDPLRAESIRVISSIQKFFNAGISDL